MNEAVLQTTPKAAVRGNASSRLPGESQRSVSREMASPKGNNYTNPSRASPIGGLVELAVFKIQKPVGHPKRQFCRRQSEMTLFELERYEAKVYSQNGEDGLLAKIFDVLGATNRFFVEFGTGSDGSERNTRLLEERHGWRGLLMDVCAEENHPRVRKEKITADNVNDLFAKYDVPDEFDLLSIDIDGNDYWVRKAIDSRYRPRVLVMEYNASFAPPARKTIAYDENFRWNQTDYFGASLAALESLNRQKGYTLVYCERRGINSFYIRSDLLPENSRKPVEEIYRAADYARGKFFGLGRLYWPRGRGYRREVNLKMIDV